MNPLVSVPHFPAFSAIQPQHVAEAITQHLHLCRETLTRVSSPNVPATWATLVQPMQRAHRALGRAWSCVGHLNAVVSTPELRDAYQTQLPLVTAYFTEVSQHHALYEKYKSLRASTEYTTLSAAQQKLLNNELRDFVLGGAELAGDARTRFAAIEQELATLGAKFDDNVLDTMNAWSISVDASRIGGLPEDVVAAARAKSGVDGQYTFTMHQPAYLPVMQYATDRGLREAMYHAVQTRGSDLSPLNKPEWDNAPLIENILRLRAEKAALLGYQDFAELSLARKMAKSPSEVMDFLTDLGRRAKPFAERDMQEVRAFAAKELGISDVKVWDVPFASEKLRQSRYAYSELELQRYFPEDKVLAGLYRVIESLYNVSIVEQKADTWHPAIRFFAVNDAQGQAVGHFYLDLYARENKQSGAWADSVNNKARLADGIDTPVVFLTCNFPGPVGDKPAYFAHDDVITLFHEFGHGLHVLLSAETEHGLSGWDGVEWDAVELPSQFMENYCYEWEVLQHMTAHAESGAPLPRTLYDKVIAAKNFQTGMQTVRQLEFGLFDMRVHTQSPPHADAFSARMLAVLDSVRADVAVLPYPSFNRMPMAFSHIFAGGYAAGYYSYKWAEVLSADAYAAFEEEGILSHVTGKRFLTEIIGRGGTRNAMENFVAFRGREPSMDALLRHGGLQ